MIEHPKRPWWMPLLFWNYRLAASVPEMRSDARLYLVTGLKLWGLFLLWSPVRLPLFVIGGVAIVLEGFGERLFRLCETLAEWTWSESSVELSNDHVDLRGSLWHRYQDHMRQAELEAFRASVE